MKRKILFLRLFFCTGALLDGLMLLPMLIPAIGGLFFFGNSGFTPSKEYQFAMGMGASLMAGWTALLIWAAFKPLERKGIAFLTVFPTISGLLVNSIFMVISRETDFSRAAWKLLFLSVLGILGLILWFYAGSKKEIN